MKSFAILALLAASTAAVGFAADGDALNPAVAQTVKLIEGLEKEIMADGKQEQADYDKYACWCEKTLQRKAVDISTAKETISDTQTLIKKLEGEIASHGAEIAQLNKDIADNKKAVTEATEVRDKEYKEYAGERTESEQCTGALEAAIGVLNGAGTKTGFLQSKEAELYSVVAGVRTALGQKKRSSHEGAGHGAFEALRPAARRLRARKGHERRPGWQQPFRRLRAAVHSDPGHLEGHV